jgi:hypothetical protein
MSSGIQTFNNNRTRLDAVRSLGGALACLKAVRIFFSRDEFSSATPWYIFLVDTA